VLRLRCRLPSEKDKGDLSLAEPQIVSRTYALDPTLEIRV